MWVQIPLPNNNKKFIGRRKGIDIMKVVYIVVRDLGDGEYEINSVFSSRKKAEKRVNELEKPYIPFSYDILEYEVE